MNTEKKLYNIAKRYLVEDEQIIYIDSSGKAIKFKQKNDKIVVEKGL